MGQDTPLTGPDFAAGFDASSLADGEKLLGHAHGEAVLLARVQGEILAIGASCTHYGGPLAEGAIVGDTIRCPWHHACFSLRTGEALRAPALNPVARWNVEQRDGRWFVGAKVERDALAATYPTGETSVVDHPARVVILGAGAAGSAAAEMLRRCGYTGTVTLIDREPDSPYDRPNLSKDYLAGNAPEEWIPLRPAGFYQEHAITVVRAVASTIDLRGRRVELEGHDAVEYDALLIATGADPIVLDLPGATQPHVHYLRSLADSRVLIEGAKQAKRAVVMGASFIGLEVAASLRTRGLEVHVVAPEALPLERVMGADLGRFIKELHEEKGVAFHLGTSAERVEADVVVLKNGERVPADLVVIGVGVRPRLALAEQAGLTLDRGVVVDELLRTSDPHVWAAGDIARWPDPHSGASIRVEHWVVAQRMGQAAARNILGAHEPFTSVPFFWSAHYDVSINYVGHAESWDRVDVSGSAAARDVAVRFVKGDRALAVATIFRDTESLAAEIAMEHAAG